MNKKILIAVACITLIAVSFVIVKQNKPDNDVATSEAPQALNVPEENNSSSSTIASEWQWAKVDSSAQAEKEADDHKAEKGDDLPFTQKSVHDALYAVKIDENGDIVLDNDALLSLDEALERIYNKLDAESILKLQDLIRDALPGKVGEQTAEIVSNYNEFLKAKEQFSQLHENTVYNGGVQSSETVKRDQSLYSDLQSLREVHLGNEVTQALFREHDATAEFMFESMKLGFDDSLSPEAREQRRQEVEARYREIVPLQEEQASPADGKNSPENNS
jgi:hypothetical protein